MCELLTSSTIEEGVSINMRVLAMVVMGSKNRYGELRG
ncbi:hypothetical protein CSCA_3275 [Clostridium scatologenes]|uniref:Uncharacterized protein n=1 Tax=Clostridium scatologenes TaxID=1548 RepID=A0A0E3M7I8_CLOSL|nr:hypothetical protein CSCA_3275 [Clostridium scatologenes]